jgi:uncharacterized protein (TIGR00375 family)
MQLFSDLHIHSKYSRACSKDITLESLTNAAKLKGLQLLGTGDFTHPLWFLHIKESLIEIKEGSGFYIFPDNPNIFFVLSSELNFVFSRNNEVKRVHFVALTKNLKTAEEINKFLSYYGNLEADGRPTLSLDPKIFLKQVLEIDPDFILIPAHIWTPWFGILGSVSGFNSIEECFEELTENIFAIETGLSSDPPMNFGVSFLDNFSIVSFSDAHSASTYRIGREATVFELENLSFTALKDSLKKKKIVLTIEFFPEEGKYHYDGHRICKVSFHPSETKKINEICPVCQKKLTIGVLNRVLSLTDKNQIQERQNYIYLVPLLEIISSVLKLSLNSKRVQEIYSDLIENFSNEYSILIDVPIEEIEKVAPKLVALAIDKVRKKDLKIIPGFDGEYGKVEIEVEEKQGKLF